MDRLVVDGVFAFDMTTQTLADASVQFIYDSLNAGEQAFKPADLALQAID
ncbi:hypothetical protein ACFHW2_18240 [Actinomadura sp. LOL_016]